ncbi:MAG: ABC transporter permease subunit, partial [Propionibacteriales bacterium]|nr:ABC transporter permease subunit [Propionibacteriales bacterium]
ISTLLFLLMRLSGDPAAMLAGPQATPEQIEGFRTQLGLDRPLIVQYWYFITDIARLDFGFSYQYQRPVMEAVMERFPASLQLTFSAVALALVIAIPVGIFAAVRRGRLSGSAVLTGTLLGQSVPNFVLGILLILVFAVTLGWLPSFGRDGLASLILPTLTLSAFMMARQTRLVRAYMVEELSKDYVRAAQANGIPLRRIRFKHALRNVMVPVVGLAGIDVGQMFGGAVITEVIFAWPGMGRLLVDAVLTRDYPLVQAAVFVIAVLVVVVNFVIDLLYRVIDPTLGSQRE